MHAPDEVEEKLSSDATPVVTPTTARTVVTLRLPSIHKPAKRRGRPPKKPIQQSSPVDPIDLTLDSSPATPKRQNTRKRTKEPEPPLSPTPGRETRAMKRKLGEVLGER